MSKYIPFKENQTHIINDLNIENISDEEISIYGELVITKDANSINNINHLIEILEQIKQTIGS